MIQREIERRGISTVSISLAWEITEKVKPPRAYFLKYPYGHAFGEPFNKKQQMKIFKDCLELLESAEKPGTISDSPYRWKRHSFG